MVIDLDRCTACEACVVACRVENNVPVAGEGEMRKGRAIQWNQFHSKLHGEYPALRLEMFPRPCMHCEDPPCVKVCPVEATYKDAEGRVLVRYDKCIGCRYCMVACPYGARYFNWLAPDKGLAMPGPGNPDVVHDDQGWLVGPSQRPRGVVEKCTFCVHRLQRAKQEGIPVGTEKPRGVVPACVQTCPASAMAFGDLEDPNSDVYRLSNDKRAFRLLEHLGTKPQVYFLKEG
jgi:molybdopterin-containing oxidoreductase family iron-sulfur binding subunit